MPGSHQWTLSHLSKWPKALWTFSLKLFRCTQSFSDIVNHDKIHAFEVVLGNMKPKLPKSYILSGRRRLCQDPEDVQLIHWAKFQYYKRNEGISELSTKGGWVPAFTPRFSWLGSLIHVSGWTWKICLPIAFVRTNLLLPPFTGHIGQTSHAPRTLKT